MSNSSCLLKVLRHQCSERHVVLEILVQDATDTWPNASPPRRSSLHVSLSMGSGCSLLPPVGLGWTGLPVGSQQIAFLYFSFIFFPTKPISGVVMDPRGGNSSSPSCVCARGERGDRGTSPDVVAFFPAILERTRLSPSPCHLFFQTPYILSLPKSSAISLHRPAASLHFPHQSHLFLAVLPFSLLLFCVPSPSLDAAVVAVVVREE